MPSTILKKIRELEPHMTGVVVIAEVMSKTDINIYEDREDHVMRGILVYTLRDIENSIINCKCWGHKEKIESYNNTLKIGDIVDVIHPKVMIPLPKLPGHNSDSNLATQSVPYMLLVIQGKAFMEKHNPYDTKVNIAFNAIRHKPHKPLSGVSPLIDCMRLCPKYSRKSSRPPTYIDLMVVVAAGLPIKVVKNRKNGEDLHCLELMLVDESTLRGMVMCVWSKEWIDRIVHEWVPLKTVLYFIDMKLSYSKYFRSPVLCLSSKTIVYQDPIGPEKRVLYKFVVDTPITDIEVFGSHVNGPLPLPESIHSAMTIKQIYKRLSDPDHKPEEFAALVCGVITYFDIDGDNPVISRRCKLCKNFIPTGYIECLSEDCQNAFPPSFTGRKYENFFNINMQLTDNTGTLLQPRLCGELAEKLLGTTVQEFSAMDTDEKTNLKWMFLLNHVQMKVFVKKPSPIYHVVSMSVLSLKVLTASPFKRNGCLFF